MRHTCPRLQKGVGDPKKNGHREAAVDAAALAAMSILWVGKGEEEYSGRQ